MSYKIDLHTHSIASPDGALTAGDYQHALEKELLDFIAVTDHNTIAFARQLQAELGDRIIIGEEIKTTEGEIIGLYLKESIPSQLSPKETIVRIRNQGGLVYIPHPFETVRSGISMKTLETIAGDVDIIEVHNGRAVLQNRSEIAKEWAVQNHIPGAASSDAHGVAGWGRTYSVLPAKPTRGRLAQQLHQATYEAHWPGFKGLLYPKVNRFKKKIGNA